MEVSRDFDSITFDGKLTDVPIEYVASLKNNSKFTFIFGKKVTPPEESSTVHSTTLATATEELVSQPPTPELPNPTSESNSNQESSDINEQETIPTTSGGSMGVGPIAVILLVNCKLLFV